ncbi:MAG: peptidase family protein [Candidatus Adlerbacteria bacterium]|nr:peptidase family protein [Candidatus Adlerbacteria bacterium]
MSEKPLLLESSKTIVLAEKTSHARTTFIVRVLCAVLGTIAVLIGLADVSSRIAEKVFGNNAALIAFAPAAALNSPNAPIATATSSLASGVGLVPVRLKIPVIGVDANVEHVGVKPDGSMDTPKDFSNVAWYQDGPRAGAPGNTVIDGHVNNALTKSGVFEHLSQIKKGDYMTLYDAQGHAMLYQVDRVVDYPFDNAPLAEIFSTQGPSQLVLITCDGDWIPDAHSYNQRLVVYAKLINQLAKK